MIVFPHLFPHLFPHYTLLRIMMFFQSNSTVIAVSFTVRSMTFSMETLLFNITTKILKL